MYFIVMNVIKFQGINHLPFWCIINQENGLHMLLLVLSRGPPTSILSRPRESLVTWKKKGMLFAKGQGVWFIWPGTEWKKSEKNIHTLLLIIAEAKYIPKWFSIQYNTQPVIDSEMSTCP